MRNNLFGKLFGLAAIAVVLAGVAGILTTNGTEAAGPDRVVAGVGIVPGQGLVVHVAVLVGPGQSDHAAVNAALAAQGARPITSAEYSLTGLVHDGAADGVAGGNTVSVVWNGANLPSGIGTMDALVTASIVKWNEVTDSALVFNNAGSTSNACPSLLRECPGAQVLNGVNEVAFWALKDRNTLAVTWSHAGTDEFDITWNTKFKWVDDENDSPSDRDFDAVTVGIHEFGHGAGIGHSDVSGAVMEAVYDGGRRALQPDDKLALNVLYGGAVAADPTPTPEASTADLLVLEALGGPYTNRQTVTITVRATLEGVAAEGATVSVRIVTHSGKVLSGSTTANSSGDAVLTYKVNAGRDGIGEYFLTASSTGADSVGDSFFVE